MNQNCLFTKLFGTLITKTIGHQQVFLVLVCLMVSGHMFFGTRCRTKLIHLSKLQLFQSNRRGPLCCVIVSWVVVWGRHWAVRWPLSPAASSLQFSPYRCQSSCQRFSLYAHATELWNWKCMSEMFNHARSNLHLLLLPPTRQRLCDGYFFHLCVILWAGLLKK